MPPTPRIVRGACPHDCPDTCALQVTVQGGRVMRVQGDPDHPTDARRAVHQGRRATPSAPTTPSACCTPLRRIGPKGSGQLRAGRAGTRRWTTSPRACRPIAARDPQAILPYSYAGTMGLVQGESMAARFFHKLGASLLDRTICASAGGEALAATYGGKVGMHVEHFAESRLILIWGSNSIATQPAFLDLRAAGQARRRQAGLHRPAPHRDRRQVPPAHRAAARHRRRAGAGPDARADRATTGWTTTTSTATSRAGRRCASARCSGRPSARPRSAASRADEVRGAGARLRHARSRRRSA